MTALLKKGTVVERLFDTDRKKRFIILAAVQVLVLSVLLIFNQIHYATNDDTTMVDIASGGYVTPSQYIINIHILVGIIYKLLFNLLPGLNWVTLSYLFVYLFSFIVIDLIFSETRTDLRLVFSIVTTAFIILVSYFSFTIVAYCSGSAGILALLRSVKYDRIHKPYFVAGVLLVITAVLFRGEVFVPIAIILLAEIIYRIKDKNRLRYFLIFIFCLSMMIIGTNSNLFFSKLNETEKQHLDWGEIRSAALDCAIVPYDKERFDAAGISYEKYQAMYNAFYYDYENVSIEDFEKLIELNTPANKYNFDLIQFITTYLDKFETMNRFSHIHFFMFYVLLFIFLCKSLYYRNKKEIYGICIMIAVLAVEFAFFFIQRDYYRVVMPNYILASLLLLIHLEEMSDTEKESDLEVMKWLPLMPCLILMIALVFRGLKYDIIPAAGVLNERGKVLEYMIDHNENLYLAGDPNVFLLDMARPIWEYTAQQGKWNLMGNWEIYGAPYYNIVSGYGIKNQDNLLLESVDSENIKVIVSCGKDFPSQYSYILSYLKKYHNIDAEFIEAEHITDVSVDDDYSEVWMVYDIRAK
jgi:hypothetical protein